MEKPLDLGGVLGVAERFGYDISSLNEESEETASNNGKTTTARLLSKAIVPDEGATNSRTEEICINILIYPNTHTASVFIIEDDGVKVKGGWNEREGPWMITGLGSYSGEINTDTLKTMFVVKDLSSLTALRTVLEDPLKYGKERGLTYTRRRMCRISDAWVPQCSPDIDLICSYCGKSASDDSTIALKACSKCKAVVYCGAVCQKEAWKQHKKLCVRVPSLTDSALRWAHVAVVTGLATDVDDIASITNFCDKFDRALYEPHVPPSVHASYTRWGCGSICTLANLLYSIGAEHHGAVGIAFTEEAIEIRQGDLEELSLFNSEFPTCRKGPSYLNKHRRDVEELRNLLQGMRPSVRVQLIAWQFQRIRLDLNVCLVNSDNIPIESVGDAHGMRSRIYAAHRDYSHLVYGEDPELNVPMNYSYGLFTDEDSDSDGDY